MSNFLYYSYPWKFHHEHIQNFFSTKPAWSHLPTSVMTLLLTHSQKWVILDFAFLHSPTFKSFQFYLHNACLLCTLLPSYSVTLWSRWSLFYSLIIATVSALALLQFTVHIIMASHYAWNTIWAPYQGLIRPCMIWLLLTLCHSLCLLHARPICLL